MPKMLISWTSGGVIALLGRKVQKMEMKSMNY